MFIRILNLQTRAWIYAFNESVGLIAFSPIAWLRPDV
jgi:hypothetical protein